jgi:glycosyltransferase involved in cell wall biosynthesis
MKTLFVLPDLFRAEGGIARIMRLYLRAVADLSQPGDHVAYAALLDRPETSARAHSLLGETRAETDGCAGNYAKFIGKILRGALTADRVICAHLHFAPIVWFVSLLRPGLRYHVVAHGIEVWRPYRFFERRSLRRATSILCVSEYTRRQVLRFDPRLAPHRVVVLPNTYAPHLGADTPSAAPTPTASAAPRLLLVSRLLATDPYKGVDLMIEAMPQIRARFPGATLRVVGTGDDLPRLQQVRHRACAGDAVEFLGAVNDETLREEYRRCDLFALPSRKEGFGLVYLEAMSWGKPCLAARAGGAPEVVGDQDSVRDPLVSLGSCSCGALVEYGNVDDIAVAVADLLRHPRDPATIRRRADDFAYPNFVKRLQALLATEPAP